VPQVQWHHCARSLGKPVHLNFRLACKETDGPEASGFPGYPQKIGRPLRQVPGRIGQLPGQSPHRSVREGFPHTVPQA